MTPWAEAFWDDSEDLLTPAFLERCAPLGETCEKHSGADTQCAKPVADKYPCTGAAAAAQPVGPTLKRPRSPSPHSSAQPRDSASALMSASTTADAHHEQQQPQQPQPQQQGASDAAAAAWAALCAAPYDVATVVLGAHPTVEAVCQWNESRTVAVPNRRGYCVWSARDVECLPPPLRWPVLRRIVRSPDFRGQLHFDVTAEDAAIAAHTLCGSPEATSVSFAFASDDDVRAAARLLRLLQPLSHLTQLGLSVRYTGDFEWVRCTAPGLAQLSGLTQLEGLSLSGRWVTQSPAAAVLPQLTWLRALDLEMITAGFSEMAELAQLCCGLRGLTSLSCVAVELLPVPMGAAAAHRMVRNIAVPFDALAGLQHLAIGGMRCGPAFEEGLAGALPALTCLSSLSLGRIEPWPEVGEWPMAYLQGVLRVLPTSLVQLRITDAPLIDGSANAALTERLPQLTRLQRLALWRCHVAAAVLLAAVKALRCASSPAEILISNHPCQPDSDELAALLEDVVPRPGQSIVRWGDDGFEEKLKRLNTGRGITQLWHRGEGWDCSIITIRCAVDERA